MVASHFIIWTTASTLMFSIFLAILVVLVLISALGVHEGVGFVGVILIPFGLLLFGLLGVFVPHRWAIGDEHSRQSYADIRSEYPALVVYSTSVGEHWAWVQVRGCSDQRAVQVPMYRQPKLGNHYWLTSDRLFVAKPQDRNSFADFDSNPLSSSRAKSLC